MKDLPAKLRLIYKPFLLITLCFIAGYTLLHYLLVIRGGLPVHDMVVKFWLPCALPWIPIVIWLRPRVKLLRFKKDSADFGFLVVAGIAICLPTVIAQHYLETATGRLTALDNIHELGRKEKTKYYTVKNYHIDKDHIGVQNTASITGKHDEDFNMAIYIVMPIVTDSLNTETARSAYWLGTEYRETIPNSLTESEKEQRFRAFAEKTEQEFTQKDFRRFTYLETPGITDDLDEYNKAIGNTGVPVSNGDVVLIARAEPFAARNGTALPWTLATLGIGLAVVFLLLLSPRLRYNAEQRADSPAPKTNWRETFDLLLPKEGYYITPILINANLAVYLVMVFAGLGFLSFEADDLLRWGGNFRPETTDGQWWRLLSSVFLHGGLMHLFANMYGLFFVGILLEPALGKRNFALLYLTTGLIASAASIWWYEATVSVGASGAIFGLYGFFLACLLRKVYPPEFGKAFLASTLIFIGFNLLMGIQGGIDNAAHIGGLLSGFLIGMITAGRLRKRAAEGEEYNTVLVKELEAQD